MLATSGIDNPLTLPLWRSPTLTIPVSPGDNVMLAPETGKKSFENPIDSQSCADTVSVDPMSVIAVDTLKYALKSVTIPSLGTDADMLIAIPDPPSNEIGFPGSGNGWDGEKLAPNDTSEKPDVAIPTGISDGNPEDIAMIDPPAAGPVGPVAPKPVAPVAPVSPNPARPVAPAIPVAPVAPAIPVGPVTPKPDPAGPVAPVDPVTPNGGYG